MSYDQTKYIVLAFVIGVVIANNPPELTTPVVAQSSPAHRLTTPRANNPEFSRVAEPASTDKPVARILTGRETSPRPWKAWERIDLDASGTTDAKFYQWSVFADFAIDIDGDLPPGVEAAIRLLSQNEIPVQLPIGEGSPFTREFDEGLILNLTPIPGKYWVTLSVGNKNGVDVTQLVVEVDPYPTGNKPPSDPDPIPDPPNDAHDLSDQVSGWLEQVDESAKLESEDMGKFLVEGVGDNDKMTSHELVEAKLGIGWRIVLDDNQELIDAWKPFIASLSSALGEIRDDATVLEYRSAVSSVGHVLW